MNALYALLLAQVTPEAVIAAEPEIVVLAQKLKKTRFVWKASDESGTWKLTKCKIKKSSGDKAIDSITCRAVEQCLHVLPAGAKQSPPGFGDCLTERRNALIAELATQRAAAMDARS